MRATLALFELNSTMTSRNDDSRLDTGDSLPARHLTATRAAATAACLAVLLASVAANAEQIGSVDTVFKFIGPNHKIVVEAYDDPSVRGVTCHVSRAKAGGISGAVGIAEDPSDASIACRQVGPISFPQPLEQQQEVFSERTSILFKRMRIVRIVDAKRNALVYLTYSDKLIEGSPKNSITTVPVDPSTPIPIKR
jgi:CreA protein